MVVKLHIFTIRKFLKGFNYTCLAVIAIGYALKKEEKYYLPVFLK